MQRVLITGAAGYVGLPLSKRLTDDGHSVVGVDDLTSGVSRGDELAKYARLVRLDVNDRARLVELINEVAPDAVIHLAARHFIPECNRRPVDAVMTNVLGTESVLDACSKALDLEKVIVTSSAAVYPPSDRYVTEEEPVGPNDIYGISKATNERQAERFSKTTDTPAISVRLYNVYGPGETNPHVIPEIVRQLANGGNLRLGNTAAKRSYVYVDDVVDGFVRLLSMPRHSGHMVVNLGSRQEVSVMEVLDILSELLGRQVEVEYDPERGRASDRPFLRCDPSRLESLTGWRTRYSMREGLAALLRAEGVV